MTGIVLQARLDSSRLPGKAMLPLDGKAMVFRVMEALNHIQSDIRILACSKDSFASLKPLAEEADFHIFAGPKENVLKRYCQVIRHFSLNRVIRATGDNPFVFADAASALNSEAVSVNADYSGYSGMPLGAGVESVSAEALLRAGNEAVLPFEREHVCPFLYNHGELFKLHRPLAPVKWQLTKNKNLRLTVDTLEDYEHAIKLYNALRNETQRYDGTTIIKIASDMGEFN